MLSEVDASTRVVFVNTPHNPTGSVMPPAEQRKLAEVLAARGIPLVVDEVYHPIYHGTHARSVGEYSGASVLGDFSKSFSLPGLRIGFMLERDAKLRAELANAHSYFTTSTNILGELLAEVATKHRETIWNRARSVTAQNLALLDEWAAAHEEQLEWLRPSGSLTAFPRLRGATDAQPFCVAAATRGVLVAIGAAFGAPAHFRIGFGLAMPRYGEALDILGEVLESQSWR